MARGEHVPQAPLQGDAEIDLILKKWTKRLAHLGHKLILVHDCVYTQNVRIECCEEHCKAV